MSCKGRVGRVLPRPAVDWPVSGVLVMVAHWMIISMLFITVNATRSLNGQSIL